MKPLQTKTKQFSIEDALEYAIYLIVLLFVVVLLISRGV
jgi:hypothetical protein